MEKLIQRGPSSLVNRLSTGLLELFRNYFEIKFFLARPECNRGMWRVKTVNYGRSLLLLLLFMAPQMAACCCTTSSAAEKPSVVQALLYERVGFPKTPECTLTTGLGARVLRREIGKNQAWDQAEQLETAAQAVLLAAKIDATKVALPPRKHNLLPDETCMLLSHLFLYDTYILQRDGVQRLAAMPVRLELQFQIGRYFLEHEGLDNYNRGVRQEIVGGHTYVWAPGVLVPTPEVHRRLTACKEYYYAQGLGGVKAKTSASSASGARIKSGGVASGTSVSLDRIGGARVKFDGISLVRFDRDAPVTSVGHSSVGSESVAKGVD